MLQVILLAMLILIISIVALLLLLRAALLVVTVRGESMAPALRSGDRVLLLRCWLAGRPQKDQIVAVMPPDMSFQGLAHLYLKRVVAVAGESISATLHNNVASPGKDEKQELSSQVKCWEIPPDHVFVCGDNRELSIDSRSWGPLPLYKVKGIVVTKLKSSGIPAGLHSQQEKRGRELNDDISHSLVSSMGDGS